MGKYFGTDGFRGEANINLTVEHAYKVGRYIGWYFNQKSSSRAKIVIGKDTREIRIMLTTFGHVYNCIYSYLNIPFRRQTEFIFIICGYLIYI